jgi:3-carboxy-cis,cis-muconate cycloisomerase
MKRSSSPSDRSGSRLFAGVFSRGDVAREVSDSAWLQAMLDVEAALARALARAHLVAPDAAQAVTSAARADAFDVAQLGAASAATGNPVVALVDALMALLPKEAAVAVHRGATSQDVLDSAMMLLCKRAGRVLIADLAASADACAALAQRHRRSLMVGRTLLQHALPITFGLKAAGWLTGLNEARARLEEVDRTRLGVQFGGAAGTLASLDDRGVDVADLLAEELGLSSPVMPWHTLRLRVLEFASALAGVSVVLGKIARDITLLAQSEIREVLEPDAPGRGGSSTMPHKRNPVGAIAVLGCTRRIPGLLATLVAAGEQAHERAAGSWHVEWETVTDLARLTGSAASWTRELLEGLQVDAERMRSNLQAAGGFPLTERLTTLLAPSMGLRAAKTALGEAALRAQQGGQPLLDVVFEHSAIAPALADAGLDRDKAAAALDPETYLGSTQAWIDRALASHHAMRRGRSAP